MERKPPPEKDGKTMRKIGLFALFRTEAKIGAEIVETVKFTGNT